MNATSLVVLALTLVGQSRMEPRITCPDGASNVELPAPSGGKVLRCVDDNSGNPHGPEIWLRVNGFYWQRGSWEQGQRHGTWDRWYATGHLLSRVDYNLGQVVASRCLTEQKRREQQCTADWMPLDWQPPGSEPPGGAAEPAAPTADDAAAGSAPPAPSVAPMPELPPEGGG